MAHSHLVGSVPLETPEQVFRTVLTHLRGTVDRVPDGEAGDRKGWIAHQFRALSGVDGIEDAKVRGAGQFPQLKIVRSVGDLKLGDLGYRDHALASYDTFAKLGREGVIPADVRFQICFPTPIAVVGAFVAPEHQSAFEPIYERALLDELEAICAAIPHDQLAIQWDVAIEVAMLEDTMRHWLGADPFGEVVSRLVRIGDAVPPDVQLGYHLCYGYRGRRHFKEPEDLGLLARMAAAIQLRLSRPLSWIHMPVPVSRHDEAYFAPLKDLDLGQGQLFLGLVHREDGVAGTQARIRTAQGVLGGNGAFGVATECGMGQYPPEALDDLLRIHAMVTTESAGG